MPHLILTRTSAWANKTLPTLLGFLCKATIVVSLICFGGGSYGGVKLKSIEYNGEWWLSVSQKEQIGFLHGLYDCRYRFITKSDYDYNYSKLTVLIGEFYQRSNKHVLVFDAIGRLPKSPKKINAGEADDNFNGFDYTYWAPIRDDERLGFVKGYISCHSMLKKTPKWSRGYGFYVGAINKMYNIGDIEGEDEFSGAIVDALNILRD